MKKNILIFLCLVFFSVCLFSENITDIFKDVIPESIVNYDQLVQNPIVNGKYIENLDFVKGKILKCYDEEYYLHSDGNVSYGDSEEKDIYILYYFYDNNGRINKFIFTKGYPDRVFEIDVDLYEYKDGIFLIRTTSTKLYNNKITESVEKYKITKDKNKVFLFKENEKGENLNETIYSKVDNELRIISCTIDENNQKKLDARTETIYKENIKTIIRYKNNEVYSITEYKNNIAVKKIDKDGNITILTSNAKEIEYHPAGFIELEYYHPQEHGSPGLYQKSTIEILDKPDELLLKYFPELKE